MICNKHNKKYYSLCSYCLLETKEQRKVDTCCCDEIDEQDRPCIICEAVEGILKDEHFNRGT